MAAIGQSSKKNAKVVPMDGTSGTPVGVVSRIRVNRVSDRGRTTNVCFSTDENRVNYAAGKPCMVKNGKSSVGHRYFICTSGRDSGALDARGICLP